MFRCKASYVISLGSFVEVQRYLKPTQQKEAYTARYDSMQYIRPICINLLGLECWDK